MLRKKIQAEVHDYPGSLVCFYLPFAKSKRLTVGPTYSHDNPNKRIHFEVVVMF